MEFFLTLKESLLLYQVEYLLRAENISKNHDFVDVCDYGCVFHGEVGKGNRQKPW